MVTVAASVEGIESSQAMARQTSADSRRRLPSVDRLLRHPHVARLVGLYGRALVTVQARRAIDALRERLDGPAGDDAAGEVAKLPALVASAVERELGPPLRPVLNATGIFLHTNLGRAPLPPEVVARLPSALAGYCDLELDLDDGRRGDRNRRADRLLRALTGAEAGLVVNNNAAALVLILATLAGGREAVVSRGELVEIGGSFRLPEIVAAAGVRLVEVGATNRTRLADYRAAAGPATGLLLKVNPSNYRLTGFVEAVAAGELAALGRELGVPVAMDEGSGLLRPSNRSQLADHPSISELVADGCDLVCGSGDKLLGGPQAGLIVGRRELVERCRRHPLYRALRPDRGTFAALEAVLRLRLIGHSFPVDALWVEGDALRARLEPLAAALGAEIVTAEAFVGGGAAPERPIPGPALALPADTRLLERLRRGDPPVVGYIRGGRLVLDLRTVDPAADARLEEAVRAALAEARA